MRSAEESRDLLPPPPVSSLLPAFPPRLRGQPEPHQTGHLLWAALSLAVVEVVQEHVVPGGLQQTQVCVRVVVCLLLGTAVPFSRYLWERLSGDQTTIRRLNRITNFLYFVALFEEN